jgi:SAM-dependent methyltransferase
MSDATPLDTWLARFADALADGSFTRFVLARPRSGTGDLRRVAGRPVVLRGAPVVSVVHSHATRDVTKNLAAADAVALVRMLLGEALLNANLCAGGEELELRTGKRGTQTLRRGRRAVEVGAGEVQAPEGAPSTAARAHDRAKHRAVDIRLPFLTALGVTDAEHRLVPAMARKWKQINKFVEVLDHALESAGLKQRPRPDGSDRPVAVLDFGSGKGYLTFALHQHLQAALGLAVQVTGVELREDLVALGNRTVAALGLQGLAFEHGDVRSHAPRPVDVMVALHACDTATDHAIAAGVAAGARVIVCSPCCHKELRSQLLSPHPIAPILKHGVHLGLQAEMLTDGLRALVLEACGYETQVFEFVALEHTNKNKMILAVRRAQPAAEASAAAWLQVDQVKAHYGIHRQCLETLLRTASAPARGADVARPV